MTQTEIDPKHNHPLSIPLVDADGHMTTEGISLFMDKALSPAQREALREQALRQEVFNKARAV